MATKKATNGTPMRRCVGSRTFGIEPHDAPVADFPVQPSRKDGLGVMCRSHWTLYTRSLRQAAKARQAAGEPAPGKRQRAKASMPEPVVDGGERQRTEHAALEARLEKVGGAGTDVGQAILAEAAERSRSARRGSRKPGIEVIGRADDGFEAMLYEEPAEKEA